MNTTVIDQLRAELRASGVTRPVGRISAVAGGQITVTGLSERAAPGDLVSLVLSGAEVMGEVISITPDHALIQLAERADGIGLGAEVFLEGPFRLWPDDSWIGRVIDPFGRASGRRPLPRGPVPRALSAQPPDAAARRGLGARMASGLVLFDTLLPIVRGQRIGLFAGPGVGKSTLLARLARGLEADVVVFGLVGERGRELREFTDRVLGPTGMARSVVVAASADRPALVRRRAAEAAMTVAEHFRDQGKHVLLLLDSVTRYAEAHREIALAAGEAPALRGHPPSMPARVMELAERAGPGADGQGDITAVFSVLVAGSEIDEPVSDTLRGVLDGHVVLSREIAERGRFPAVDVLQSVSRALPEAASEDENARLNEARRLLGLYDRSELMLRSGLYTVGSDPELDRAVALWPGLDALVGESAPDGIAQSFAKLAKRLDPEAAAGPTNAPGDATAAPLTDLPRDE